MNQKVFNCTMILGFICTVLSFQTIKLNKISTNKAIKLFPFSSSLTIADLGDAEELNEVDL